MNYNSWKIALAIVGFSIHSLASSQSFPLTVSTVTSGDNAANIPNGVVTRAVAGTVIVNLRNSCFGTNLRHVANPLSPSAVIHANFTLNLDNGSIPIAISYPASVVTAGGMGTSNVSPVDASKFTLPAGSTVGISGNTVVMRIPASLTASVQANGTFSTGFDSKMEIASASFSQEVLTCAQMNSGFALWGHPTQTVNPAYCGPYMGQTGVVSAVFRNVSKAADNTSIDLSVAFPGQSGFCGGYFSPLMVFFDEARPKFTNKADFPLNPSGKTMWTEANAPGYFLALDSEGKKIINKKEQLFGGSDDAQEVKDSNGFEALRVLDSNKDNVIDSKDKSFSKLVLWQDKNGNGKSEKNEVFSLAHFKIKSLSLNYKNKEVRPLGLYAEEREKSTFVYIDKKGKKMTADIVDIWLSPVPQNLLSAK